MDSRNITRSARTRTGKGAKLRQKKKFLTKIYNNTGNLDVLQQIQEIEAEELANPSPFYHSFLPTEAPCVASQLLEPLDLHEYIALHPQTNRDKFGLPCYGPDFKTPAEFHVDMFQMIRIFQASPDFKLLPPEFQQSREIFVMNTILQHCDRRLSVMDLKFENADELMIEIENLQSSGKIPTIQQRPTVNIEPQQQPAMYVVEPVRVQSLTSISEDVPRQTPQMAAPLPKRQMPQTTSEPTAITPVAVSDPHPVMDCHRCHPKVKGGSDVIPVMDSPLNHSPPSGSRLFLLGNWAEECLDSDEENHSQNTPADDYSLAKSKLRLAVFATWVNTLKMRYHSGCPGPPELHV